MLCFRCGLQVLSELLPSLLGYKMVFWLSTAFGADAVDEEADADEEAPAVDEEADADDGGARAVWLRLFTSGVFILFNSSFDLKMTIISIHTHT